MGLLDAITPVAEVRPPRKRLTEEEREARRASKTKRCAKCKEKKLIAEFPKHSTSSDGVASYCRECKNSLAKERRLKDPIARFKHYTVTRIKNEWPKNEVPEDIQTNLEEYLGYKLWELKRYVKKELKEREGITLLKAFKLGYHLDHIKPHSSFDMKTIGDLAFKACWHFTNLRLISSTENLQKGAKTDFYDEKGAKTPEKHEKGTIIDGFV